MLPPAASQWSWLPSVGSPKPVLPTLHLSAEPPGPVFLYQWYSFWVRRDHVGSFSFVLFVGRTQAIRAVGTVYIAIGYGRTFLRFYSGEIWFGDIRGNAAFKDEQAIIPGSCPVIFGAARGNMGGDTACRHVFRIEFLFRWLALWLSWRFFFLF